MICKKSPNNHGLDLWWIITYFSHCQRFNLFYLYLQIQNFILLTDIKFLTFKFRASTGSPALPCKYLILLAGSCFGIYQMSTSYSGQSHIIYKRLKNCNYLKYKLLHWPNYIVTLVKKKKEIPMDMSKLKGRIPLLNMQYSFYHESSKSHSFQVSYICAPICWFISDCYLYNTWTISLAVIPHISILQTTTVPNHLSFTFLNAICKHCYSILWAVFKYIVEEVEKF